MSAAVDAVAITGTIGAGKTTLAEAISGQLHERGIRHALVDLDWLGQVYPTPDGHGAYDYKLALHNLKDIWPNFQAAGAERAVIAGTLLNRDQRERLEDALGLPLSIVLVEAPPEVLEARIRSRDSEPLLSDFLARTEQVAAEIRAAGIHDLQVINHGRSPKEIGLGVLKKVGWVKEVS